MDSILQIKPKCLYPGDTIGIIAPASCGHVELSMAGVEWIKQQGFHVELGKTVEKSMGYLAGDDEERAADINAMFARSDIDGIVCLRGGYGSMRLLHLVDYELIRTHPKVFVGYSDITALHTSIRQRTGLVTFHGPMVASDMAKGIPDYTWDSFYRSITEVKPLGIMKNPPLLPPPVFIKAGKAQGYLTGGNLSLIVSTLGTPYEIDTCGKILCLEEVGESPYRIDRMLTQLRLAGKLQQAAGIVIATCADCDMDDPPGFTLAEVLTERLADLQIPILYQLYFGHTAEKLTLPLGVMARIGDNESGLEIIESATTQ